MERHLFIFGLGYTGLRLGLAAMAQCWQVSGTVTSHEKAAQIRSKGINAHVFKAPRAGPALLHTLGTATHILATAAPSKDWQASGWRHPDPVLSRFSGGYFAGRWTGYLSSTGVYGDVDCAWVDENSPANVGLNKDRESAERGWIDVGAAIFRLPGIYGPGRSMLERAQAGTLRRVVKSGHLRSRIHVDDIVQAVRAAMDLNVQGEILNIADDEPAPGHIVEEYACHLLDIPAPPRVDFETADVPPQARRFFTQCRRVKNAKMKSVLGIELLYPTYKEGLRSCMAALHK